MTEEEREKLQRAERAFHAALELPEGQDRDSFITDTYTSDPGLGEELKALLASRRRVLANASPSAPEILPRCGPWQAVRVLGKGGMGTVYLAERSDGAFQMSAAVKIVPLALASPEIEERFLRERQFLALLSHPGIARLIDGGVAANGLPFLVMEFVDGEPIHRFAAHHSLAQTERIALFRQILEALAYVHSQHVLHRDLKPSNVLVDKAGRTRLVDFGIAKLMTLEAESDSGSRSLLMAFTPDYASPEQLRNEPLTASSDLFSAGILLHTLLTRHVPKRNADTLELSPVNANIDAILKKATAPNPGERYQSAEEFDRDLALHLAGKPVLARRRSARSYLFVAAAAILMATLLAVLFLRSSLGRSDKTLLEPGEFTSPALSPDGRWIAYVLHSHIWLRKAGERSSHQITWLDGADDHPALSQNGDTLLFDHASTSNQAGIYRLPLRDGKPKGDPQWLSEGFKPKISPNGRFVAYERLPYSGADWTTPRDLRIVPLSGGASTKLDALAAQAGDWVWAADSSGLLTVGDALKARSEFLLKTNGNPAIRLGRIPLNLDLPSYMTCGASPGFVQDFAGSGEWLRWMPGATSFNPVRQNLPMSIKGCQSLADGRIAVTLNETQTEIAELPGDPVRALFPHPPAPDPAHLLVDQTAELFSVSLDNRWFAWKKHVGAKAVSFLRGPDLQESPLPAMWITIAPDGTAVLMKNDTDESGLNQVLSLPDRRQMGTFLLDAISWDLSNGGRWALCVGTPPVPRSIGAFEISTGVLHTILLHPNRDLYLASFSPNDSRWIVFTAERHDFPTTIYVARFDPSRATPPEEWIPIARGDYPRWDPTGSRIYYLAPHGTGILSMKLDPVTKRPAPGATPESVYQFSDGWGVRALQPGTFRIGVTRQSMLFNRAKSRTSLILLHH